MASSTTAEKADCRGSVKCTETFWPTVQSSLASGEIKFSDLEIPCCICYDTVGIFPHQHRCDESGHHHGAVVLPCGHIFGQQCLRMALETNARGNLPLCCPSCRASVVHEKCGHSHAGLPMPNSMSGLSSLPAITGKGGVISEQCNDCLFEETVSLFEQAAKVDHLLAVKRPNSVGVSVTVQGRTYSAPSDASMVENLEVDVALQDLIDSFSGLRKGEEASGLYWYDTLSVIRDMQVNCYVYQSEPEQPASDFDLAYQEFKSDLILFHREQVASFSDEVFRATFELIVRDNSMESISFWEYAEHKMGRREDFVGEQFYLEFG
ncbi:hypothetical protein FSARC_13039 [Fusarium sarcochroum]|uniref:RING-type domain-containing protein n=1 Tax=Fusarium sarcochroum TaxID=1208366 RepID=A0A8H4WV64_9HYPO|nr:hypothetical protein FSARC_13039 [Fusarium sarcochroum]